MSDRLSAARAYVAGHRNRRQLLRLELERDRSAREVWAQWQEQAQKVQRYLRARADTAVLIVAALSALPWEWM